MVEGSAINKWQKQRFAKHKQKTPKKNIVLHNPSCFFWVVMMYRANHPRKNRNIHRKTLVFGRSVFFPFLLHIRNQEPNLTQWMMACFFHFGWLQIAAKKAVKEQKPWAKLEGSSMFPKIEVPLFLETPT